MSNLLKNSPNIFSNPIRSWGFPTGYKELSFIIIKTWISQMEFAQEGRVVSLPLNKDSAK